MGLQLGLRPKPVRELTALLQTSKLDLKSPLRGKGKGGKGEGREGKGRGEKKRNKILVTVCLLQQVEWLQFSFNFACW